MPARLPVTKTWSCSRCDHKASVSTETEKTADEVLALIVEAHALAGCDALEAPDG
jgi:transcription elongation factor Elf1